METQDGGTPLIDEENPTACGMYSRFVTNQSRYAITKVWHSISYMQAVQGEKSTSDAESRRVYGPEE
jgi:hypothetical protein